MNNVIVYKTEDDGVAILYPSENWSGTLEQLAIKDVPKDVKWSIVDISSIPKDVVFRSAWKIKNNVIVVDITKAKEIWLDKFRKARILILAALDIEFMRAVESGNKILQSEIAFRKQALRDVTSIDLPNTLEGIKATWPDILGQNSFD
jgi:hypothetical protein